MSSKMIPPRFAAALSRPGTTIGMTPTRPMRTDAQPVQPNAPAAPLGVDRNTDAFTYLTKVFTGGEVPILYNGDRQWAKITLLLLTAGPVVVGTKADLAPVNSGKGRELITNIPFEITIGKTSRLYIISTAVNRVAVTIEPLPWLEQITLATEKR